MKAFHGTVIIIGCSWMYASLTCHAPMYTTSLCFGCLRSEGGQGRQLMLQSICDGLAQSMLHNRLQQ